MPTEPDYQSLPDDAVTKPKQGKQARESKDARAAKVLGKRLCLAQKVLDGKLRDGEAYAPHIDGEPPKTNESPVAEAKKSIGEGWNKTTIPAHGMLISVLTPSLIARAPTYINRARKSASEKERARGKVYTELAKVIERESGVHDQMTAALDDTFPNTVGWLFVDYDPERKLPLVRRVPCSRVLVDTETDGRGFMRDIRWVAEKRSIPVNDARWLADNVWGAKSYEFKEVEYAWDEDDNESEPEIEEVPTKFAKLVFMYLKGNNPYTARADLNAAPGDVVERSSEDPAYTGQDELLILECRGEDSEYDAYKIVARQPWPFPCDPDELPATPLRLTTPRKGFYPPSLLQPSHGLQVMLNWAMTFYNTDVFNSARRFVAYDPTQFPDDKSLRRAFGGSDNLALIKATRAFDKNAIMPVSFGQPNPAIAESVSANQMQYDQVSGRVAFDAEQRNRSHQTATGATISNESAQVRIGRLADLVEQTYKSVMRKALQCARFHMSAEDVASWIGEDLLAFEEAPAADGTPVMVSNLWNDADRSPEAIRKEVDIDIEPRSVRFVSPEQEVNDIQLLMDKQVMYAKEIKGSLDAQMPEFAVALAKAGNAAVEALAERLHLANAEAFLIDLNMVIPPPPEPAPNAGLPGQLPTMGGPSRTQRMTMKPDGTRIEETSTTGPEMPHPGGAGPTPQVLGKIMQMIQAGTIDPSKLPPDIQAALAAMMQNQQGGG